VKQNVDKTTAEEDNETTLIALFFPHFHI
jgi:hypothetical protein